MKEYSTGRESGISRVVSSSEEVEKNVLEAFQGLFKNQIPVDWEELKTPEEIKTAEIVLRGMPDFFKKYGGEMPPLTSDHVHNIPVEDREKYPAVADAGAAYVEEHQRIYSIDKYDQSRFLQGHVLAHEFLHFASFQSISAREENGEIVIGRRRVGMEILNHDDSDNFFGAFNEALTEELALAFSKKYLMTNEWINNDMKQHQGYKDANFEIKRGESREPVFVSHAYEAERTSLHMLIADLYKKNQHHYTSENEIFNLFAAAGLTGRLLPLARLIEKTYGKGSFRKIGEMTKGRND